MKRICLIIFCFMSLFICINDVLASEIYCESGYELFTDSDKEEKCKKSLGAPMIEFSTKTCPKGRLIDDKCYEVKDPIVDGCESNYEVYTDSEGNKMCKKNLMILELPNLLRRFVKKIVRVLI